jgi:hypothetical protein
MLGITWRNRKCYIKTGLSISTHYYQSSTNTKNVGLGQGSTAASDIWCIINGILMHILAASYIGFAVFSVSSKIVHRRIGEGLIDDTGLISSSKSSSKITPLSRKRFTIEGGSVLLNE